MLRQQPAVEEVAPDPADSARVAGLRYVHDDRPGIRRKRAGARFAYVAPTGKPISDPDERLRIKALAIPPAWTDVWICPDPSGHLQATGRDARGRKQYRYHQRWGKVRDEAKFERVLAFGQALPRIRGQAGEDLKLPGLPRRKVLATIVQLLENTLIRVGNDEYARDNGSFGLTTLQDEHAHIAGAEVRFSFRGKSGVSHTISLRDRRLARVVKQCRDSPGQRLFQYLGEDGEYHGVYSEDVNDYLHEIAGQEFTAKDFRTWAGTVLATQALREFEAFESQAQARKNVMRAVEWVAERLGNTTAICHKCYVHPSVIEAYMDGAMAEGPRQRAESEIRDELGRLSPEEAAVLGLLRERLAYATASK